MGILNNWITFSVITFFVCIYVILGIKDYYEIYSSRLIKYEKYQNFYKRNCLDAEIKQETGTELDCFNRGLELKRPPWMWAFFDVAKMWRLCGENGCEFYFFSQPEALFKVVVFLVLLYAIIAVVWGNSLYRRTQNERYHLYEGMGSYYPNKQIAKVE